MIPPTLLRISSLGCYIIIAQLLITASSQGLSLQSFDDVVKLDAPFDPTIAAYWTQLYHRRRVPLASSPTGKKCYLAHLEAGVDKVHVLTLDCKTFKRVGETVVVQGHEAGALIGHDDGFTLLTNQKVSNVEFPIAVALRFEGTRQVWKLPLNGPGVHPEFALTSTPDLNGDLVYSEKLKTYCAYFVVTAYTGDFKGHFGDASTCFTSEGKVIEKPPNSPWGCSHNTGIGLEVANELPFLKICAEDTGAIWLNTETNGMSGAKIANVNAVQGTSGEPMGGMGGSYSVVAKFRDSERYIFSGQSRGAINLKKDTWMTDNPKSTTCQPRTLNHNVAIAILATKSTLLGEEASTKPGSKDGDTQENLLTRSDRDHHQNVRVATFDSNTALVTWDNIQEAKCQPLPQSCTGKYAGTSFQLVDSQGRKKGEEVVKPIGVGGDIADMVDGRLCWVTTKTTWSYEGPKTENQTIESLGIACASLDGGNGDIASGNEKEPAESEKSSSSQGP